MEGFTASADAPRTLEDKIDLWLKSPEIDLAFDPFRYREAQIDPHLPLYIIDDDKFTALWAQSPTILYAPEGGGKTSFRRRLTHACRSREESQTIFPIILDYVRPAEGPTPRMSSAAAHELLLQILFWPEPFLNLTGIEQKDVVCYIETYFEDRQTLQFMLRQIEYQLEMITDDSDWEGLTRIFDTGATRFFISPPLNRVHEVVVQIKNNLGCKEKSRTGYRDSVTLLSKIVASLGYSAMYLMVDGIDAFPEAQKSNAIAMNIVERFLTHLQVWAELQPVPLYLKLFLPSRLRSHLEQPDRLALLTPTTISDSIVWNQSKLRELIRSRLRAANRHVVSLGVLSGPDFRDADHAVLTAIEETRNLLPRHVVALVEDLFAAHVTRVGLEGRLERQDLDQALETRRTQLTHSLPGSL